MIKTILGILALEEYKGVSDEIDIAKGKYQLQTTLKGIYKAKKREQWQLKK